MKVEGATGEINRVVERSARDLQLTRILGQGLIAGRGMDGSGRSVQVQS